VNATDPKPWKENFDDCIRGITGGHAVIKRGRGNEALTIDCSPNSTEIRWNAPVCVHFGASPPGDALQMQPLFPVPQSPGVGSARTAVPEIVAAAKLKKK